MGNVAILGAGPAGLLAAHAAVGWGHNVRIFSRKKKSHLNGAQYLHALIPGLAGLTLDRVEVRYRLVGEPIDYRIKVYGSNWDGTVSAEDLEQDHSAWDIRAAYDWLWDQYSWLIEDREVVPATVPTLMAADADLIVSSVPAPVLCTRGHTFGAVHAWAAGEAPGLGISLSYACPDNTVICNGDPETSWYRVSNIFGHKTVEWPDTLRSAPPVSSVAQVTKPTFNNCDCWPDVLRIGRYGKWTKGTLAHEAFSDVNRFFVNKQEQQ